MIAKIIKRDGRKRKFNSAKIATAVMGAMTDVDMVDKTLADTIAERVVEKLETRLESDGLPTVEVVQDLVEETLVELNQYEIAKAFILFREERTQMRETKSGLMKAIEDIAKETTRDNANVGNSPSAKMLQIGSEASKWFTLNKVIPKKITKAHLEGRIHIHDLDYFEKTINCIQMDLAEILERGFDAGRGYIRPPKSIGSACALSAIVLQSNQNDMYGGQSFDDFDNDIAPYIKSTENKLWKDADLLVQTLGDSQIENHKSYGDYIQSRLVREVFQAMEGFVYNLNTMHSRAGAQTPFSSLNIGCPRDEYAAMACEQFLLAFEKGLGKGETPLFPNVVFRVKDGVNGKPGDPYYYLFRLALRVAAKRMNPTFSFMDSSFNIPWYNVELPPAYMGCRATVNTNKCGDPGPAKRGNIAPVTINLVRLAIEAKGSWDRFYKNLDEILELSEQQLLHRKETVSKLRVKDLPFLMGQGIYRGSEGLNPDDTIEKVIENGTFAVGFIGLAETLIAMMGSHHGDSREARAKGLEIMSYMRQRVDDMGEMNKLNFTLYATPAEGLSDRFLKIDKEKYGIIAGVTDKDFYTNSYHVPVGHSISIADKLAIEADYHALCNAGHISYVELNSAPGSNIDAMEGIITYAKENNAGYVGVNFPIDECYECGWSGVIDNACPVCGATDIRRIRRITGYLSTTDRFGSGKTAELKARVTHN